VRLGKKRTAHVLNKIFYPAAKRRSAELCRVESCYLSHSFSKCRVLGVIGL